MILSEEYLKKLPVTDRKACDKTTLVADTLEQFNQMVDNYENEIELNESQNSSRYGI